VAPPTGDVRLHQEEGGASQGVWLQRRERGQVQVDPMLPQGQRRVPLPAGQVLLLHR